MNAFDLRNVGQASARFRFADRTSGRQMRVLKALEFIGYPNTTMTNSNIYTFDGVPWTCGNDANGGLEFLQGTGLHATRTASSSSQNSFMYSNSVIQPTVGYNRWLMGNWQIWAYVSSYTFTGSAVAVMMHCYSGTPFAGASFRRSKNVNGGANTADGSIIPQYFWNSVDSSATGAPLAVTPANVWMINYRTPWLAEYWYGTWSTDTGWPKMEDMSFLGVVPFVDTITQNHRALQQVFADMYCWLGMYSIGTADSVFQRIRFTTYD